MATAFVGPDLAAQLTDRISLGQHREIADLHADGDLLRRRSRDLQAVYDARPEDVAQIGVLNASICNWAGDGEPDQRG
jgi:hypothetical protein